MAVLGTAAVEVFIPLASLIGIAFAVFQWYVVARVPVTTHGKGGGGRRRRAARSDDDDAPPAEDDDAEEGDDGGEDGIDRLAASARCAEIQQAISIGATSFLLTE
ncbi:unnamed protein product [Urochloa humidicola]